MHGVNVLPPDSPQIHQPSPNNNALPPKPPHLAAQATSSFRQKKPPMPSPPLPLSQSSSKMDPEVRSSIALHLQRLHLSIILFVNSFPLRFFFTIFVELICTYLYNFNFCESSQSRVVGAAHTF